jgi:hypothetical protein
LLAPISARIITPEYVPDANPVRFAVAVKELGAIPELGSSESHGSSEVTVQPKVPDPVFETATAADGLLPPWVPDSATLVGVMLIVAVEPADVSVGAEIVKLTGIVWGVLVAPLAVTVILAEYVPAARPGTMADAVNEPAPVPEVGEIASQDTSALTPQLNLPVPALETATACSGRLPPF